MISVSFVNGDIEPLLLSDPVIALENSMLTASNEIDSMISDYLSTREDYLFESMIMDGISEEKALFLEAGKDNIFKKIGDTLIDLYKKFEQFVKGVIENLKNIGFKSKSDTEKLEKLLKAHPELKDEVIFAYKQGDLNVADAKTLKELNASFDEIVKLSKQKDIKPDTLRGKFEAFKKKADNIDNSTAVKVAKTAGAVVTAAGAIFLFKKHVLDARKASYEYEKTCREKNEDVMKAIKELERLGNELHGDEKAFVSDNLSKAQILKNARLVQQGLYSKLITKEKGKVEKLDKGITSFISKHMKKESSDFIDDMHTAADIKDRDEKEAAKKERKKSKKDSKAKSYGAELGKKKAREKHADFYNKTKEDESYHSRKGSVDYDRDTSYRDVITRARIQAEQQDEVRADRDAENEKKKKNPQTINVKIVKDKDNDKDNDNN